MHSYDPVPSESTRAVDEAIKTRRSIRAFLPTPVSKETIEEILAVAARAPSGSNIQPWKVTVLMGEARLELSRRLRTVHDDPQLAAQEGKEYEYYPLNWTSPYIDRRRTLGWELYRLAGIQKGDKARMHAQHGRNFDFFDAPVGLIFTMDRILELGSWIDFGAFLENIMIAARGRGLDTCPQAAFAEYPKTVMQFIDAPASDMLVCGMALGHADPAAAVNALITEREVVAGFTRFMD